MSRIRIYGDTSGYIDVKAPDVAGNTDVVIPEGGFVGQDEFTSSLAEKAPSASPTFTGTVGLPLTTNYDGTQLSTTLASKLNVSGKKVLQVVSATRTTTFSTTSSSYVDWTNVSVSITPTSTSSTVLALVNAPSIVQNTANTTVWTRLVRGSTAIYVESLISFINAGFYLATGLIFMDAPATTSTTTYKAQVKVNGGTGTWNGGSITLMEISA